MILVLGGTSESRDITELLFHNGFSIVYAATTEVIKGLPDGIHRFVGCFEKDSLLEIIQNRRIRCVVDATHPFATGISTLAIEVTKIVNLPYIRFERQMISQIQQNTSVRYVDTVRDAAAHARMEHGAILATIGTRMLSDLCRELNDRKKDLIVRVLPCVESLKVCEALEIDPGRIIAMRGPFTKEFDRFCIKQYDASVMIAKESGERGGLHEKMDACREMGCMLIVIHRPKLVYPCLCSTAEECLAAVYNTLNIKEEYDEEYR